MITVIPPGTAVAIGSDPPFTGQVTGVAIYANNRMLYQVAWWSGREHREQWLEPTEIAPIDEAPRQAIGFVNGQARIAKPCRPTV